MIRYIIFVFFLANLFGSINKNIIIDSDQELLIELEIFPTTDADLFPSYFFIGLPNDKLPITDVVFKNQKQILFSSKIKRRNQSFEWTNQQKIQNLETAILKVCPMGFDNTYFENIQIKIKFNEKREFVRKPNKNESLLLSNRVLNWETAQNWFKNKSKFANKRLDLINGELISFKIFKDEINKIDFSSLSLVIPNINQLDPRAFKLFMSSEFGRNRSQNTNLEIPQNLVEIAIHISGENDGSFDEEDFILFFGRGPSGFSNVNQELVWSQNLYFTDNKIWLYMPYDNTIRGKRISQSQSPSNIDLTLNYGISHLRTENDMINIDASGTLWLDRPISSGKTISIQTAVSYPNNNLNIKFSAGFKGHSSVKNETATHVLTVRHPNINGNKIGSTITWSGSGYRTLNDISAPITLTNGLNYFSITNSSPNINSIPYFDYIELKYGRQLNINENYFFSSPTIGENIRFIISGISYENIYLWDISQPGIPKKINISNQGHADWENYNDSLGHFALFNVNDVNIVTNIQIEQLKNFSSLRNSNIQADFIIIGPSNFKSFSEELIIKRQPAIYAELEKIYKEFSAGNPDPMAIRTFIQWTQENWQTPAPYAALILGDSGYDYRNINGNSGIVVPTIQVSNTRSYATDDRLATIYGNIPEIALGRFPARNSNEVENFVNKIIAFEANPEFGPWKQKITLVADDASRPEPSHGSISTGKSHTLNSEELSNLVPKSIFIDKIYMLEFPEVGDASAYGVIKPAATQAMFDNLNSGTAILSYIGHGSPIQLAQEKLLYIDRGDINNINTGLKLPLWIVGTCSFGHFDDPLTESFAEELIRQPMNAASMIISTTRPITVTGNERYTKDLFEAMFPNNSVSSLPVGVILQSIKNGNSESEYFHLFGDPMMKLPIPSKSAAIHSISPDTLRTLETGSFFGGTDLIPAQGFGSITLFDADRTVTRNYLINSQAESLSYVLPGATLFRGQFSFENNSFSSQFRIPQDISYSLKPAKILIYIFNENQDAIGKFEDIIIAGGQNFIEDNLGPQISFENTKGSIVHNSDHFANNENLVIRLSDPIGINLTNEIGHEIILRNIQTSEESNITNQFYYDYNSIVSGTIILTQLNEEQINLEVEAWDNANNPNKKSINLKIHDKEKLKIFNAYNFPNPFSTSTQFIFELTKNAEITLDVFSLGGRKIKHFKYSALNVGYHYIDWNTRNDFGDNIANGVYLYVINAINSDNKATHIGRCVKFE